MKRIEMIDINELRLLVQDFKLVGSPVFVQAADMDDLLDRIEKAEKERDALRAKIEAMEKRLRLILEEPENTMSNSKAMREMIRQARLALEESK